MAEKIHRSLSPSLIIVFCIELKNLQLLLSPELLTVVCEAHGIIVQCNYTDILYLGLYMCVCVCDVCV